MFLKEWGSEVAQSLWDSLEMSEQCVFPAYVHAQETWKWILYKIMCNSEQPQGEQSTVHPLWMDKENVVYL